MIKYFLPIVIVFSFGSAIYAQTISGNFNNLQEQEIRLEGYSGFETYLISSTSIDRDGNFEVRYTQDDVGVGYLISSEEQPFLVILSGEDIHIRGEVLSAPESITFLEGEENLLFEQYTSEHPRREQALSAWRYLENIYTADSLFAVQKTPGEAIQTEIERIRREDQDFLQSLDPESYVSWYLPVRRLVSSVPVVAQYRTEEIPETIRAFREIDHIDERLYKSGLLGDVIESHIWLIENSGRSLDLVFVELNRSIDGMIENLSGDPEKLNEIAGYLFDLLEERSLFTSSEHLALNFLENHGELLSFRLASKLEIYRAMKPGNIAPEIVFTEATHKPEEINAGRLSELQSDYTLIVFAANWCEEYPQMMTELKSKYSDWRSHGVEIVLINLEDTQDEFSDFTSGLPFIRTTDFQKWDSPVVQDYHVHSLPAMVLLNSELEILLHPNSVGHMDAWVDWYLVRGNL